MRTQANFHGLVLEHSFETHNCGRVKADKLNIQSVLFKLLRNAIQYTPSGKVKVLCGFSKNKEMIVFEVIDTGISFKKSDRSKLFQQFVRLSNAETYNPQGLGLSLYICRKVVEVSKGKIWATSNSPNHGSTFGFKMPATPISEDQAEGVGDRILEQSPDQRHVKF